MRDSFIFYRSFQKAIDACSQDDQLLIYKAIANYALDRVEPDLSGVAQVCWVLIKPQLDNETGIPLKNFLDQTRADFAARLLLTSNKSLTEIAKQLEFRDVYAFSRFFKRLTGRTLSEYRNHKPYSC